LRANFTWTLIGNVLVAACQWGLLALLTRTTTDETTGQYVIALSICTPLFIFAGLDLRTLQATDSTGEFRFAEYLCVRLITGTIALLIIPGIAWCAGYDGTTLYVILGVAVGRLLNLISDTFDGLMQKSERMDRVSHSIVLRGLLSSIVPPAASPVSAARGSRRESGGVAV